MTREDGTMTTIGDRTTPTRLDVARPAGVSPAVVSYVLNGGPRGVAAATRSRVLAAISDLGYRPNAVARSLKVKRTHSIGLLVPDISNPYFAELARAIEDEAYRHGFALLLANSNNDMERELTQLAALRDRQVDGLMLISTASGDELAGAGAGSTPFVLLDRALVNSDVASVVVDNRVGARMATDHLLRVHGGTVDCMAGPADVPAAVERELGWREAIRDAGDGAAGHLHRGAFTRESGYEIMTALIDAGNVPRAMFVSSDLQAIGVLRAAHEHGIHVPEDLAIVSFDGTSESEFTSPPLAVIRQPAQEIAHAALQLLLGTDSTTTRRVVVSPTFVPRASCGCG